MTYYTPFILNDDEWDLIVNPPPPEDYTFVYFCLIIIFIICPILLGVSYYQVKNQYNSIAITKIIKLKYSTGNEGNGVTDWCGHPMMYKNIWVYQLNHSDVYEIKIRESLYIDSFKLVDSELYKGEC